MTFPEVTSQAESFMIRICVYHCKN